MTFRVHTDSTFVRDELHFGVHLVPDEDPWTQGTVRERHPKRWEALEGVLYESRRPAIVYAMSRRDCEELATAISESLGEECLAYHAGLGAGERRDRERAFISGTTNLIVATSAFGMGIDKPDVRTVIHWTVPPSPEALYQEAGRAGRGRTGQPARAVLLFNDSDLDRSYRLIRRDVPTGAEVARTDRVLTELAHHDERDTLIIGDDDLARLAMLRADVQPRVVLAHLERAGLVREIDRFAGAFRADVLRVDDLHATDLQRRLLALLNRTQGSAVVIVRDLVDQLAVDGSPVEEADIRSALNDLEKRGVLGRRREVSVALLDRPSAAAARVHASRHAALTLWRLLEEHRERHGPRRFMRDAAARVGDAGAITTAIEVLAAYGLVETAWSEDGRTSLPGVRRSRHSHTNQLGRAFAAASALCGQLASKRTNYELDQLASASALPPAQVLDGLTVLHIVRAASVDLEGWSDGATARRLMVLDVDDRDDRLRHAERLAMQRAREQRLRLEVLRRYASIEADNDPDVDAHQAYLHRYLSEPRFLDVVAGDTAQDTLTTLNEAQQQVVLARADEPLVVIAGPGTGKTLTVVHRIAYRVRSSVVLPERILAATFSRAATEEVRARLAQLGIRGVHVRTLHSFAVAIVRDHWAHLEFTEEPSPLVARSAREKLLQTLGADDPRADLTEIDLARAQLRQATCGPLASLYDAHLRKVNQYDLAQALVLAAGILQDDERSRPYLGRYDEILVDEFQDLSPAQIQLVERLAGAGHDDRHLRAHLTVVGDPRQAIFEWNGATPDALLRRSNEGNSIALVENYRCDPAIIRLANGTIHQVLPNLSKVQATKPPSSGPVVSESGHETTEDMVTHVVGCVRHWLDLGIPDEEIAVLAYRGATVSKIGKAMRTARIPSHEVGLTAISQTQPFQRLWGLVTDLPAGGDHPAIEIVDRLLVVALGENPSPADTDDAERLRAELLERQPHRADDLVDVLDQIRRDDEGPRSTAGVTLTTLHKAKGLEWDAVVVTDAGRNGLDSGAEPERCRLLYVGLTRARNRLDISWSGAKSRWMP